MRKEDLNHSSGTNAPPDVYESLGGLAGWLNRKADELEKWTLEMQKRRALRQMLSTPEGRNAFIEYTIRNGWTMTQVEQTVGWARMKPLKLDWTHFPGDM